MHTSSYKNKYLRANYTESNMEEDIDLRNQFRIRNLPDTISIREAASKLYIDNYPSLMKNTAHVSFKVKNLDNVRFVKVNFLPSVSQYLTPRHCVDDAIDEKSLVRNNQDSDFNNHKLAN